MKYKLRRVDSSLFLNFGESQELEQKKKNRFEKGLKLNCMMYKIIIYYKFILNKYKVCSHVMGIGKVNGNQI